MRPVVIPQTIRQALQRDHLHRHASTVVTVDPHAELAGLRAAVRRHEDALRGLAQDPAIDFTENAQDMLAERRRVDLELWEHAK